VTQFGWLSVIPTYALVSTYIAVQTQANGNPTQSVTTFTINTAWADSNTLNLASCTITFQDYGTGDTDCTDGIGMIDTISSSSADQQATILAGFTFTDYIPTYVGVAQFSLNYTASPIDGNLSSIETGGMVVADTNTVVGLSSPIAQVVDFIPANPTVGEAYVTTIDTVVHNHIVSTPETVAQAVTGIVASLSGNTSVNCADNITKVTCTAKTAGTPFTYAANPQDITAPVVTLSLSGSTSPTNTGFTIVSTFSEPVWGVNLSKYVIGNGVASDFTSIDDTGSGFSTIQTIRITPTANGIVTINMPSQAGVDYGGNESNAATQISINYDIISPTVALTTVPTGISTVSGSFTTRATFSEPVVGFSASGFILTNATLSGFTPLSSTIYQATITPINAGSLTVDIPALSATDIATNWSIQSNQLSITVLDTVAPVVTLVGSSTQSITQWNTYIEQTAIWTDYVDGSGTITPASSGTVDTSTLGTYTLSYTYTDIAGNVGNTVTRDVTVVAAPDTTPPVVTLSGSATMTISYGSLFSDPGADWTDNFDGSATINPASSGTVDTSTLGTYSLDYTYTDFAGNIGNTVTRTVIVTDQSAPVVTLQWSGSISLLQGSSYIEDGATWTDNIDGSGGIATASSGIVDTSTLGTYTLEYTYTDMAGNIGNTVTRTINITDGTPPVVTLSGSANMTIAHGGSYIEQWATWTDTIDWSGTLVSPSLWSVDTNSVGTYYLDYTITDTSSNISNTVTRTVVVVDQASPTLVLNGTAMISIMQGDVYIEQWATWTDAVEWVGNIFYGTYGSTGSFQLSGTVDTSTLGIYTLSYLKIDAAGNISNTVMRTVTVTAVPDTTAPVVTLVWSPLRSLTQGTPYIEQWASWTDNYDGSGNISVSLSGSVNTMVLGVYVLQYSKTDVAGNVGNTVTRTVTILPDATPPVITLVGATIQYVTQSGTYTEQGASWTDVVDGSGNILSGAYGSTGSFQSTGSVDTGILGTHTITYTKVDATGNIGTATRTVIVSPYVQPVTTGGGGGVSYTPTNNQTPTTTDTGTLNAAPDVIPVVTVEIPPSSSLIQRKILRALLRARALRVAQGGSRTNSTLMKQSDSPILTTDMTSAPIVDTGILEVKEIRVNIRLAAATDAKIIGELRRWDQVYPLRTRDDWVEFQFGDIIWWTKRWFLITPTAK
jgi:Domain of unknown function (DUF5011)/Bacterial Ig-like domain